MVSTRQEFAEYCLRSLGAPVVEVNVDNEQLEDRIDEAISYWRLYHHEGIETVYLKQKVRLSTLSLATTNGLSFSLGDTITGVTSGAIAKIARQIDGVVSTSSLLVVDIISGTFVNGEDITNQITTATLAASNAIFIGEKNLKYIDLPDIVYGVTRVLPFSGILSSKSLFDTQYQLRLNDLYDLTSTSIINYTQVMNHLALLDFTLNTSPMFRFNRLQGKIFLDINWDADVEPGEFVILECQRALDPNTFYRVWNEPWLKHYATALIKRQMGTNLKKFNGVQLVGGVTVDGQGIYQEALQEIKDLEDQLIRRSTPLGFLVG